MYKIEKMNTPICVICENKCDPPPTENGWTKLQAVTGTDDALKAVHFSCAQSIVNLRNELLVNLTQPGNPNSPENIFERNATQTMISFNLSGFKKTYPTLFASIMLSIREYGNALKKNLSDELLSRKSHPGSIVEVHYINKDDIQFLTKDPFWNNLLAKYPGEMNTFLHFIDEYKVAVSWKRLFNTGSPHYDQQGWHDPKFHDLPIAFQVGVFLAYLIQEPHRYEFFEGMPTSWTKMAEEITKWFCEEEDFARTHP